MTHTVKYTTGTFLVVNLLNSFFYFLDFLLLTRNFFFLFFCISSDLDLAAFDSTNKAFIAVESFCFSASFAFLSAVLTNFFETFYRSSLAFFAEVSSSMRAFLSCPFSVLSCSAFLSMRYICYLFLACAHDDSNASFTTKSATLHFAACIELCTSLITTKLVS